MKSPGDLCVFECLSLVRIGLYIWFIANVQYAVNDPIGLFFDQPISDIKRDSVGEVFELADFRGRDAETDDQQ
jgi:hypothetical protein